MANVSVAMSGGVDSSVVAAMLKEEGHRVAGVFMRHRFMPTLSLEESAELVKRLQGASPLVVSFISTEGKVVQQSYSPELFALPKEGAVAWEIAAMLGIEMSLFDADIWFQEVIDDFVTGYYQGKTPNPCLLCNRRLKFGHLVQLVQQQGADVFATGHYIRLCSHENWVHQALSRGEEIPDWLRQQEPNLYCLVTGGGPKDQSYVLAGIDRAVLPFLRFPLGNLVKEQTRERARAFHLSIDNKKESQETCFAQDGNHLEFLHQYKDERTTAGHFVSKEGTVLGHHRGYEHYTIGQRKGLGMGFGQRIFVQQIDPVTRNVVLGPYEELGKTEITALAGNWHLDIPSGQPFLCDVKIRYRNQTAKAIVQCEENGTIIAKFQEPRYGVAPGQGLVCYFGDRLLGGGVIV